ncbi:hypothetical protein [Haloglycomyces albus]|uniref:hypothetical protein n=1 Tax=Haloglycomyces albus TaxID=526067 RepID=UPI00046D3DDF|nr:hypothetical protein [Haloglycomyces albus]
MNRHESTSLGRFQLGHRTIEATRGNGTTVWIKRLHPFPEMELGCVTQVDTPTPRLRLDLAEWDDTTRREAKEHVQKLWEEAGNAVHSS